MVSKTGCWDITGKVSSLLCQEEHQTCIHQNIKCNQRYHCNLFDPYNTCVIVPYGKPAANQLVETHSFSVERADLQVKVQRYNDDIWYQHAKGIEQVQLILESWFQGSANYVLTTRISRIQGWETINIQLFQRENNIRTSNVNSKFPVYIKRITYHLQSC